MPNSADCGVGGKLRRPPPRRVQATPYARPQQNQAPRSRWFSKLVDPARQLIADGATRVFPSLFSKSPVINALPAPNTEQQDQDKMRSELKQHVPGGDHNWTVNCAESRSPELPGPSGKAGRTNGKSASSAEKKGSLIDNCGLSEIEKLMEGKKFSRDEVDRLIEIINSRTVDSPNNQEGKIYLEMNREEEEVGRPIVTPQYLSIERKQEDMNKVISEASTLLPLSTITDEVGASPVDIAKAYMRSRTSDINPGSKNLILKDERVSSRGDEFASKPFMPSPSPKPSTYWPGAMLQDRHAYLTPQSQRGRFGLHNFSWTPYSRSIYSKNSKSKLTQLQDDNIKRLNISSTPFQRMQSPSYGQFTSRSKAAHDEHGSVGPIRRTQRKSVAETPSRGSSYLRSPLNGSCQVENSNFLDSLTPAVKKNLEQGGRSSFSIFQSVEGKLKSSEVGTPTVHPHSSQMARTILEHLERNPPTPRDKSAELKLVTSWRKSPSSDVTNVVPSEQNSLPHSGGVDFMKNIDHADKNSTQLNGDGGKSSKPSFSLFRFPSPSSSNEANDALNKAISSNVRFGSTFIEHTNTTGPSLEPKKMQNSQVEDLREDAVKVAPAADTGVLNLQKPPSQPAGTKPVLPSIFVSKPEQRWTFPSDGTAGFTFPVSSGVSSEPPTPSITPSISSSVPHQPREDQAVPSYSFGSNRTSRAPIFSFPSTSSAANHDDLSDIKFSFRSDKTTRISFGSVAKDAICC